MQVASLEDELRLKAREAEDSIEALNQKLAKQITEVGPAPGLYGTLRGPLLSSGGPLLPRPRPIRTG